MSRRITPEQRSEIVGLLKDGLTQTKVAREVGVSQRTVSKVAQEEGISPSEAHRRMLLGTHDFNKEERRKVFNFAFQRGLELLESEKLDSKAYREILTGIAIMTDKRRLEDGEVTSAKERRVTGDSVDWDAELKKADELARTRAKKRSA